MTDIDRTDTADTPTPAEERNPTAESAGDGADGSPSSVARSSADADRTDDADPREDGDDDVEAADAIPPQYGVGPFSVREAALGIVWAFAFVVSFFAVAGDQSVWTGGLAWILTIGVPTAAVFLIVLRRLSPTGIRRVGSLGIDQFASVAFSVSALLWIQEIWASVAESMSTGIMTRTWVMWVEAVLMLCGVVLTVAAAWLPVIGDDFRYRAEVPAHRSARPIRPVVPRPVVERPVAVEAAPLDEYAATILGTEAVATSPVDGATDDASDLFAAAGETRSFGRSGATGPASYDERAGGAESGAAASRYAESRSSDARSTDSRGADSRARSDTDRGKADDAATVAVPVTASQAFWALAPVERDVVDEHGVPLFRIGPTAWALVIEDRGSSYVVRNDDGRVGYLRDVSGVTRG